MREHFLVTVTFYFERKCGTSTYATIKAKETLRLSLSACIGEPDEIKAFCSTVCFCLGCRELLVDFGASVCPWTLSHFMQENAECLVIQGNADLWDLLNKC